MQNSILHHPFEPETTVHHRYRILRHLGEGREGAVYLAEDRVTGAEVTLKAYTWTGSWSVTRAWQREARALETLDHPAIPRYVEHHQLEDGRLLMVRQYVRGETLEGRISRGERLTTEQILDVTRQTLDVLTYLQTLNPPVIHGDIKPSNLILDDQGRLSIIDFAGVRETLRPRDVSGLGSGTLGYSAPEQISGRLGLNTDVYALGASVVHLLSHVRPTELPVRGLKLDFAAHVETDGWFRAWLERVLEPNPNDRFADAATAKRAFDAKMNLIGTQTSVPASLTSVSDAPLNPSPPPGSQIRVKTQGDALEVVVPGVGFLGRGARALAVFWVLWTTHICFVSWVVTSRAGGNATPVLLFLLPFVFVSLFLGGRLAFAMFGTTSLRVMSHSVSVFEKLGPWTRRLEAPLQHWSGARVDEARTRNTRRRYCAVAVGIQEAKFGHQLSHTEQQWTVALLNAWVARLRQ